MFGYGLAVLERFSPQRRRRLGPPAGDPRAAPRIAPFPCRPGRPAPLPAPPDRAPDPPAGRETRRPPRGPRGPEKPPAGRRSGAVPARRAAPMPEVERRSRGGKARTGWRGAPRPGRARAEPGHPRQPAAGQGTGTAGAVPAGPKLPKMRTGLEPGQFGLLLEKSAAGAKRPGPDSQFPGGGAAAPIAGVRGRRPPLLWRGSGSAKALPRPRLAGARAARREASGDPAAACRPSPTHRRRRCGPRGLVRRAARQARLRGQRRRPHAPRQVPGARA